MKLGDGYKLFAKVLNSRYDNSAWVVDFVSKFEKDKVSGSDLLFNVEMDYPSDDVIQVKSLSTSNVIMKFTRKDADHWHVEVVHVE